MPTLRILLLLTIGFTMLAGSLIAQATGKDPVIIIPGVTGSELVNTRTGDKVWFSVKRDKDDDLRLPMTSPVLSRNRDNLMATDIIREVKLKVLPDVEVYQSLIDALTARGYKEASWNKPEATDVFYVFPYDWRRDNVETAQLLMRRMAAVKKTLGKPGLKFDIIAHSMGGLIARYAAMYGTADLPRDGARIAPTWAGAAHINKLMMFGTPNEGSFGAFQALIKGYPVIADRKLPFVDDLGADDVMSSPSAFQLLPHRSATRFLDQHLKPVDIDIYDPANWFKYGWGALSDPEFLSKLKDAERLALTNKDIKPEKAKPDATGDDLVISRTTFAQVRAYFISALSRAKRFQIALDAVSTKPVPVEMYAYGGDCDQTLDAVLLLRDEKKGVWVTSFDPDDLKENGIKKDDVKAAMYSSGDGRVTKRSLLAQMGASQDPSQGPLSILPLKTSFFACVTHTKLFLEKPIQDSFLSALVVEKQAQP